MKKPILALVFLICAPVILFAQSAPEVGIFGGISAYSGDLTQHAVDLRVAHPSFGFLIRKSVYKNFGLRLGVDFGKISGADSLNSGSSISARNLSFQSTLVDVHLLAEYNFFDYSQTGFTPYVFLGISIYHFDPYTLDSNGLRVYLPPLSTEGEGLPQYPNRKPYALTQVSIPFGAGVKYALTPGINLGFEFRINKTFTDYLDDVSTTYVDQNVLMAARGPSAVYYSFRTNELPGHSKDPYPPAGAQRGNPAHKDWYYFTGITLTFNLNGGNGLFGKNMRQLSCPPMKR